MKLVLRTLKVFGCVVAIAVFLPSLASCSEEPYVEQINKAHDILNQGKIENSAELLKEAEQEYRKAYSYALFAIEKQYDALFNLGILHAYKGEFQNCVEVLSRAYQLRRDETTLFYYWGMCYANEAKIALTPEVKRNNISQAERIYQMGIALSPNDHQLNYGLGILYGFVDEDYIQAVDYLNTAQQTNPEDINTLFALANLNYKLGNVEASAEYFRTIMELSDPNDSSYKQAKVNLDKIR